MSFFVLIVSLTMSRSKSKNKESESNVEESVMEENVAVQGDDIGLDNTLVLVEKLQEFGVNAGDIQKLKQAGIFTVAGVMMQTKKTLLNIKGFSEAKVDKVIEACQKLSVRHKLSALTHVPLLKVFSRQDCLSLDLSAYQGDKT